MLGGRHKKVCSQCGTTSLFRFECENNVNPLELIAVAFKGWHHESDEETVCPECWKEERDA